jgi:hypothetical protein
VAVHVRFSDEPASAESTNGNNVPGDYYARAIQTMETQFSNAHYFLFSDRLEAARSRIPLPDDRITLVQHNQGDVNAYADLWLMTQCQHFIIANSTFSWWEAWLAASQDKIIVAPSIRIVSADHITSWGFEGLLPPSWILK